MCYTSGMKVLAIISLVLAACTSLVGAEKIRFNSKDFMPRRSEADRIQNAKDMAATEAARLAGIAARSRDGIYINSIQTTLDGWTLVKVTNGATSSVTFDYHQLRGLELDTGNVVPAGDVKFLLREVASYSLGRYEVRTFRVKFAGRKVAGVNWVGLDGWLLDSSISESFIPTTDEALSIARKAAVERRIAERKRQFNPTAAAPTVVRK